jgi:hypothetical protein
VKNFCEYHGKNYKILEEFKVWVTLHIYWILIFTITCLANLESI